MTRLGVRDNVKNITEIYNNWIFTLIKASNFFSIQIRKAFNFFSIARAVAW